MNCSPGCVRAWGCFELSSSSDEEFVSFILFKLLIV